MKFFIGIFIFLIFSVILFIIGYNCIFNTKVFVEKFALLAYKKDSYLFKMVTSDDNIKWVKISGFGVVFFSLVLLMSVIYRIYLMYW